MRTVSRTTLTTWTVSRMTFRDDMDSEQNDLQVDSEQDDAHSKQDTVKWTVSRTMSTVSRTD